MPIRTNSGNYKCTICGKIIHSYRTATNHERTCGITNVTDYMNGTISIESRTFDTPDTKQIKLGDAPIAKCPNCETLILESDVFNNIKNQYECSGCSNIISVDNTR